jgi:hypothetical protein
MATILDRMPICLGSYEARDRLCDGAPSRGATFDEVLPCLFRDRCVAFAKLLHETRKPREHFVFAHEVARGAFQGNFSFPKQADLLVQLDERIVRYGIVAGKITNRTGIIVVPKRVVGRSCKLGPQSRNHRAKIGRALRRSLKRLRNELQCLGWDFLRIVATQLGRPLNIEEVGARPEELFLVDALESKRFGALYYRLRRFRRKFSQRPVVRFYPRIYRGFRGSVELQVACPFADFERLVPKRDRMRFSYRSRQKFDSFGVAMRHVTTESASFVAEMVERLAREGHFGFGQ